MFCWKKFMVKIHVPWTEKYLDYETRAWYGIGKSFISWLNSFKKQINLCIKVIVMYSRHLLICSYQSSISAISILKLVNIREI